MDPINLVFGIITVLAAAFSVYVFFEARSKARVETQRASELRRRLSDISELTIAAAKQIHLFTNVADREETSKKELKHLGIAALATLESLQASLASISQAEARWRFGIPDTYQRIGSSQPQSESGSQTRAGASNG
jgi:hypothetical protein